MDYKADITLNERDSIIDLLTVEKSLVKLYATAITEGVTKEFRKTILECLNQVIKDQILVFFELTKNDYERVDACPKEIREPIKEKFLKQLNTLS